MPMLMGADDMPKATQPVSRKETADLLRSSQKRHCSLREELFAISFYSFPSTCAKNDQLSTVSVSVYSMTSTS